MLSKKKDLRTGTPVWSVERKPPIPHEPLAGDHTADVLVIGAGISGALVAEALSDAGLGVIVVDRRAPITGSTSASTALLQYEIDKPLTVLSRSHGAPFAERVWRRSRLALDVLRVRTTHLEIDAAMHRRNALYLAGDLLDARGLALEATARRRAGFEVAFLGSKALRETYGIRRSAALLGFEDAVADPRKLAAGYLRAAVKNGAQVFSPVDVVQVEESARGIVAKTSHGHALRAKFVVYATGYELAKGVPAKGHRIASTWAMATRPQPSKLWPTQCMIWEASETYLYLRTTDDGRILIGGEDEDFQDDERRDALLPRKTKTLERKLLAMFPEVDPTAEFSWTGNFGASSTGTPSIGRVPRKRRTLAVLGYGGNGITFSMLAAQIIRGIVTGVGDPDEDLFAFSRK